MFETSISLAPPLARASVDGRPKSMCGFAAGTILQTITGPRAVERIMAGDLLLDADGEIMELRSLRRNYAEAGDLVTITRSAPALARDLATVAPALVVGAGQKLGMRDWRSDLLYGGPAMIEAKQLVDAVTIQKSKSGAMLYQLGFDRSCVIRAHGLPALVRAGTMAGSHSMQ